MAEMKKQAPTAEQPEALHERAMDNLEFIRDTIQRSTRFTVVPGYGGMLMGVTAIGAAVIAGLQPDRGMWLTAWLTEAILALLIGLLAMWQKSRNTSLSLNSLPARKFAFGFSPPMIAGGIITGMMALGGAYDLLPSVWITLYGAAVITGGAFSVRPVQIMGWVFLFAGAVSAFVSPAYGDMLMAATFGAVQIIFGAIIGIKYGG